MQPFALFINSEEESLFVANVKLPMNLSNKGEKNHTLQSAKLNVCVFFKNPIIVSTAV